MPFVFGIVCLCKCTLFTVANRSAGGHVFMRSISEEGLTPIAWVTHLTPPIECDVSYPSRVRMLKYVLSNTNCLNECSTFVC